MRLGIIGRGWRDGEDGVVGWLLYLVEVVEQERARRMAAAWMAGRFRRCGRASRRCGGGMGLGASHLIGQRTLAQVVEVGQRVKQRRRGRGTAERLRRCGAGVVA